MVQHVAHSLQLFPSQGKPDRDLFWHEIQPVVSFLQARYNRDMRSLLVCLREYPPVFLQALARIWGPGSHLGPGRTGSIQERTGRAACFRDAPARSRGPHH